MSAVAAPPAVERGASTLRVLAGVETLRYARHPLFLVGTALLVTAMAVGADERTALVVEVAVAPAFLLGLLGVFVGYQLTRSVNRSADAVRAVPADGVVRTAALCLACLLPGAVALVWWVWMHVAEVLWPVTPTTGYSAWDRSAMLGVGVACAVGGPLFGVMVARWTRFPGAGLLAVVVLTLWVLLGTGGLALPASRWGTLVLLNPPFATWLSADLPDGRMWVAGGSPSWYLAYLVALCGLAATAAMLHEASGLRRASLARVLAGVAVLAAVFLTLAVTADPTRMTL